MKGNNKTNNHQITALEQLRRRIAELERSNSKLKGAVEEFREFQEDLEAIFNDVRDGIVLLDMTGKIIKINKRITETTGYTDKDIVGKRFKFLKMFTADSIKRMITVFAKTVAGQQSPPYEVEGYVKTGEKRIAEIHSSQLKKRGKTVGAVAVIRDITERKRAEEALRESETRYRAIVEAFDGLIYVCSQDYRVEFMNKQLLERTGYDGTGELCYKVLHDLDSVCPWCVNDRVFAGETVRWEVQSPKDNRWYYVVNTPIYHTDGSMSKQAMILDITERKQAEMALRESEKRFRKVVETMKVGLATTDENGILTYVNEYSGSMIGYSVDEMLGRDPTDFYYDEEERKAQKEIFEKRKKGLRDAPTHEVAWRTKDGRKVYSILSPAPIFDAEGRYQGSFAIHTEITERKRMEETLRESEEKYRELINGMNDTAWVIDFDGNFIDVNDAAVEVLGYSREELLAMGPHDIDKTLDAEEIRALIKEMPTDKIQVFKTTHTTKDGKTIPVEIKSSLVTYQGKQAILSIARDITERRRAEAALRESEERYRSLVDNIDLGINLIDREHNIIMVNCTQERHLHKPLSQTIGEKCFREFEKRNTVCPHCPGVQTMATGESAEVEIEVVGDDQRHNNLRIQTFPVLGDDGTVTAFIEVVEDITARKQAEEALRESEKRYKALYEDNPSMYFTVDAEGTVLSVNQFGAEQLGYTVAELVGQTILNVFYEDDKEAVQQQLRTCVQHPQELFHWEFRKVHKDGNIMWVKEAARAVRSVGGNVIVFIVCEDISERKQAERELRESEERHRTLFEHAGFAISLYDAETKKRVAFNTMAHESLGYTREEFQELTAVDITVNNDSEKNREHFKRIIKDGPDLYEMQLVAKNGEIRDVLISAVPIRMYEKDSIQMIRVDITDQKRADEKLKASFERLERSLESTVSALASALEMRDPYTAGHQQRVTDLACAIAEEMGLSEEQVEGIRMAGLIHDIGKINIPAEILNKPGQLTEIEYSLFKNHPQVGYDILKTVDFPWPVAQIVLQHHERMDGSGYPQGLSGEEIMLEARILAIADVVEAIASHRPYRPARGTGDALEEILRNKGTLYDPEVVDACLRVFYEKGFTFEKFLRVAKSVKIH